MLLTMEEKRCLKVLPAKEGKDYQFEYVPKDNTEEERREYREFDESHFDIFGYHVIVNYKDLY